MFQYHVLLCRLLDCSFCGMRVVIDAVRNRCPKGYGRSLERNPLDNTLLCIECPKNTFQHIDGVVSGCLPCPPFTLTHSKKSTSMSACVAMPGYFLPKKLEEILTGVSKVGTQVSPSTDDADLDSEEQHTGEGESSAESAPATDETELDFKRLREAEAKYETMLRAGLLSVPRVCQMGAELIKQVMPEVKMQISAQSFVECTMLCARNVYCTSFTFTRAGDLFPPYSSTVTNHTGTFIISYSVCEIHFYGTDLDEDAIGLVRDQFTGTEVSEEVGVHACAPDKLTGQGQVQKRRASAPAHGARSPRSLV